MDIKKMPKDELELLSNKDITFYLLEQSKKSINTKDLFTKIIKLLELPKKTFDEKIGDYYTSLATDKRFILLSDGTWDLRSRHTSDKIVKVVDSEEDDEDDEDLKDKDDDPNEIEEDNYDDTDDDYNSAEEDLKDLVVIDEDELELEE